MEIHQLLLYLLVTQHPLFLKTHQINVFDPSLFGAKLELSPSGVLSEQTPYNIEGLILRLDSTKIPGSKRECD